MVIFMTTVIVLSAILVQYEDVMGNADQALAFLILEALFLSIFFAEMILKLVVFKLRYFADPSNVFDFLLVVTGVTGLALQIASFDMDSQTGTATNVSTEGRLLKATQTFRLFRLFRAFRLLRMTWLLRAKFSRREMSLDASQHLHTMALLDGFVVAHIRTQKAMVHFFCRKGKVDSKEVCRVILQSQIEVFRAMKESVREESRIAEKNLAWVSTLRESMQAVRELEHFVLEARKIGLLGGTDTESLLQPLHDHMANLESQFHRAFAGESVCEEDEDDEDEEESLSSDEEDFEALRVKSVEVGKEETQEDVRVEEVDEVDMRPPSQQPIVESGGELSVLPGAPS